MTAGFGAIWTIFAPNIGLVSRYISIKWPQQYLKSSAPIVWLSFSRGLDKPQWTDFADRHRGSMHQLIDGGIWGNMILRVFSSASLHISVPPTVPQAACSHIERFELYSPISKLVFLVPRTTLLNLCRLKVPNGEPRICRDWPIASNNVSPFGSVSLACGFGLVRSLWPLGRNALMDAWTWTLCRIRQYLCFLLCLHRPVLKARCHV